MFCHNSQKSQDHTLYIPDYVSTVTCACIQIKAREGWNGLTDSVDALDLLKEAKIHQKHKNSNNSKNT